MYFLLRMPKSNSLHTKEAKSCLSFHLVHKSSCSHMLSCPSVWCYCL